MKNIKFKKIMKILKEFDAKKENNPDWDLIESVVSRAIATSTPLNFVNFTCSTINPKYMYDQNKPELYVSLDPKGNNLEKDLPKLESLYLSLSKVIEVKIIILIGNTDPFYIYTQGWEILPKIKKQELWRRFSRRWKIYKKNFEVYTKTKAPSLVFEIISWYELEKKWEEFGWDFQKQFNKNLKNINRYFPKKTFNWEVEKLKMAFGEGRYFYNLKRLPIKTLRIWAKRKFSEYGIQGLWIKQIFPDVIVLQNEKPSDLRTSMYQPLVKSMLKSKLPVLYPYGVDNSGFQ